MNIRNRSNLSKALLATLLLASTTIGCSDDGGDPVGNGAAYQCVRDPALLEKRPACARDVDCPCGSRCDNGRCGYECSADADCAGGQCCDYFGRCRSDNQAAINTTNTHDT